MNLFVKYRGRGVKNHGVIHIRTQLAAGPSVSHNLHLTPSFTSYSLNSARQDLKNAISSVVNSRFAGKNGPVKNRVFNLSRGC